MNDTMKYVVSTLKAPSWRNSEILGAYDTERIQRLKEEASKGLAGLTRTP
jgi:hypothetical protein